MSTRSDLIPRGKTERRFDSVWCEATEFLRDLTATFDQLAASWTAVRIIVDGIEDRSGVGEKCAKPVDHQAFQSAGRDPPGARTVPAMREVET
jgi:hypothetical protein